jgi:hypothetical protein
MRAPSHQFPHPGAWLGWAGPSARRPAELGRELGRLDVPRFRSPLGVLALLISSLLTLTSCGLLGPPTLLCTLSVWNAAFLIFALHAKATWRYGSCLITRSNNDG